ncbi:MAG: nuclear transport factor 2 family protein [Pseudomonadales bacterium]
MKQAFEAANDNIQLLADHFEISNLLLDVAAAIDNNDIAVLNDVFTANAVVEHSSWVHTTSQHQVCNAEIVIDGDTALGRTLCHNPNRIGGENLYYADKFQRTDKGWRIIERSMRVQVRG